jgi:hypothetical protein
LKTGKYPWWDNLRNNQNISIQIRKDNTLDVYYQGGAIISDLKYNPGKAVFSGRIHSKYIPLANDANYNMLVLGVSGVEFSEKIELLSFSQFEEKTLKAITDRIGIHFDSESEKQIQYKFATSHSSVIDTEFQWGNDLRVDLVHIDTSNKKLVFIEVKTIEDGRLFFDKNNPKGIYNQLKMYHDFIVVNSNALLDYYKKVLQIKIDLGIFKDKTISLADYSIEPKPLLLFGDCEQEWIDNFSKDIDAKIKDVACGAYYFGGTKYSFDLIPKSLRNRHVF